MDLETSDMPSDTARSPVLTVRTSEGKIICERCLVADTPPRRLRGLLGRPGLETGEGLLIRPTNAIHMWFMRFAIDAVFVDGDGLVLRVAEHLRPWRMAAKRGAHCVIELGAGECARRGLAAGDRLLLTPAAIRP